MTTSEGYSGEIFRKNHHFWHNHHIRKNYFSGFFFSSILGKIIIRKARGKKKKEKTFVLARSVPRGAVQGDLQLSCGEADQNVEGDQHRVYSL